MIAIDKGVIARWKIDTPIERFLGEKADNSESWKKLFCLFYKIFDYKYYKKGVELINGIIKEKYNGKDSKALKRDMIYCLHRFGFTFSEYFSLRLYEKNASGRDAFISDKMRYDYYCYMNSDEGVRFLRDKGRTYELLKDAFRRDCVAVYTDDDYDKFDHFIQSHSRFVYKPIGLDCGRGIEIIEQAKLFNFKEYLSAGAFILEEVIEQSETVAAFHPASLNTVRLPTVRCTDGTHIFLPFFRMGRLGSIVDNAGAGGIFAAVDKETGIVTTKGVTEYGAGEFIVHPDTGVQILGAQLPDWQQAVAMVKALADRIPNMAYIGWDLAHTRDGWVVVEANGSGQFVSQIADRTGHKNELLQLMNKLAID